MHWKLKAGSNMYLKSIELSGFKSFAKKNGFEFNSPISAIVGPNGSGKSNVAEAFRFVLGEQSIKSMRGKRGEDLIWNGAASEPRANRASVKVIFDNSRKVFSNVDFSEVTIERVVHRDGLNEYLINGSQVRLKDVLELLAGAHIGISSHHIISQGEADKILSALPKDRKSIVEDALGLKIYQYKRLESERKLQKTFENIGQVEALRKELAPHLKFLQRQTEKLTKTESLREELIAVSKEYFQHKTPASPELAKLDGIIMAEEGLIEREKKLALSDEHKTVRLKEVEGLYQEVSKLNEVGLIIKRIGEFIRERKHDGHSESVAEAEARIEKLKKEREKLEEAEFKRELVEVERLVGKLSWDRGKLLDETWDKQEERRRTLERLKMRLEDSDISGSGEIQKEYRETSERDAFLERELSDLDKSAKSLEDIIKDLERRLAVEFNTGLEKINKEFGKMFATMFGGGEAEFILTKESAESEGDEEVSVEEGLDIKVSLPKKKIKSLMMLSGGERALTSIALIFAISQVNPPPFIILDETDAALDESNSKKYGDLVEILSKHSQLILITHNRETMSRAGIIYGVTMGSSGVSKLLSISFDQAVEVAK
ncbi:MAG: AAA family ATPase [Candidatus Zambryskibacteria bacterium]|nr:AAA family ATPase [Candidatus Zambryskibacteria bacterium]